MYYFLKSLVSKSERMTEFMLTRTNPEMLNNVAKKKAFKIFKKAMKQVPAYKHFVENNSNGKIPETDKKNYIRKYALEKRCVGGTTMDTAWIDTSSGYSGTLTFWPKSYEETIKEEDFTAKFISFMYGIRKDSFIVNTFSLGTWVAGLHASNSARQAGCVISPGLRLSEAKQEIISMSHDFGQLVILGYPPTVKMLVDMLDEQGFSWPEKTILVTAGEGFPEEFREHITRKSKAKMYSIYGAADTTLGMGVETDSTIKLRKILLENKKLRKKLFGKEETPMIFQYDPTKVYLEEKDNGELLATHLTERKHPVIRYNLHDVGGILSPKKIEKNVKGFSFKYRLPVVYLFGRSDGTITVSGVNIYPDTVRAALFSENHGRNFTGKLFLEKDYENEVPFPVIHIELNNPKKLDKKSIYKQIMSRNSELKEAVKMGIAHGPGFVLYKKGDFPFESPSHIKEKYA